MKKILKTIGTGLGTIIGVVIALVVCIIYLLYVPFDIIRYRRMPYYKDFKYKYEFFITSSIGVKIYNRIAREQLPIEYVKNEDIEYFVKDQQVYLCEWCSDGFERVNGEWFFVVDNEYDEKILVKEALENDMEMIKPEHKELPIKYLRFYGDITDAEKYEQAKECPYFHCVFSEDEFI